MDEERLFTSSFGCPIGYDRMNSWTWYGLRRCTEGRWKVKIAGCLVMHTWELTKSCWDLGGAEATSIYRVDVFSTLIGLRKTELSESLQAVGWGRRILSVEALNLLQIAGLAICNAAKKLCWKPAGAAALRSGQLPRVKSKLWVADTWGQIHEIFSFCAMWQCVMLEGHNRSPTLALSFFLHSGHTLREAGPSSQPAG